MVHDKGNHKCESCEKTFSTKVESVTHFKRIHDGQRNFNCNLCEKTFKSVAEVKIHTRQVHDGSRDFHCRLCPQSFPLVGTLNAHVKTLHEGKMKVILLKKGLFPFSLIYYTKTVLSCYNIQ